MALTCTDLNAPPPRHGRARATFSESFVAENSTSLPTYHRHLAPEWLCSPDLGEEHTGLFQRQANKGKDMTRCEQRKNPRLPPLPAQQPKLPQGRFLVCLPSSPIRNHSSTQKIQPSIEGMEGQKPNP